jgi:zinc transport system substrate-binding protein
MSIKIIIQPKKECTMRNKPKQQILKSLNRVGYSLITCFFVSASHADVPNVVTDIAPTHSLVSMIMKSIGEPKLLIKANENPHDYRLRPSKAKALEQADIVFWIASGLTPSLMKTIPNIATRAESVELIKLEGTEILYMRENVAFAEEDHGHSENHDEHDEHENVDPHSWLSINNGMNWLDKIANKLSILDPENKNQYQKNAQLAKLELSQTGKKIEKMLASKNDGNFLVYHDAYQYFEKSFNISPTGAVQLGDATDPSPAELIVLQNKVKELKIECVFTNPQIDPRLLGSIFNDLNLEIGTLDPFGIDLDIGSNLYNKLLIKTATNIANCLKK